VAAGAQFLVTPVVSRDVLDAAARHDVPVVCGAYSPTEIHTAATEGAAAVKIFPAGSLGPGYVRDLLAPLPHLVLVPTGGVDVDNVGAWLGAGSAAVAIGSGLVSDADATRADWSAVSDRARAALAAAANHDRGRPR